MKTSLLFFFCLSSTVFAASELSWDTTEVKIEMEPDQTEARATFTVTNEGDEAVRIARIKTSCGCTGSVVDRKIIEPGKSSEIVGVFNKGKRKGLNRNRLHVYLDSQPQPVATLLMTVQIPTLIEATPQIVYWNSQSSKTPRKVRLAIDERFVNEIVGIDYDRNRLTVTEEDGKANGETTRILVVEPKTYDEMYRGTITVRGIGPGGRKADTRLHAFVQP
ncbi:MAG: DUF1573 domain-containing protein [Verrucomicrobia bacterium]|jgi:hypothetical protein|nr:DUF1573 domain-containing protein [Verrucomicrobiota bacterium]